MHLVLYSSILELHNLGWTLWKWCDTLHWTDGKWENLSKDGFLRENITARTGYFFQWDMNDSNNN